MSWTSIGQVAPFPPLPGQPFPPARNHPRWKELYRLHDEWIMKYWPFKNEKKRARIPFMNLAGFSTWCAPASDFKRMVWGARIAGIFFLADDLIDSGKMLERIPGFKQAATGEGPLHVADRAEICHDIVFRAIKATSHPRTFAQLTKCTHEWWDSHVHEPYKNLDQYLTIRRVNIAMYFANAYFRYTLNINLSDAQVDHPLMREAEGIVADHVGLTNDFFSYAKEKMSNSDDTNIVRILQDHEGLTYAEAAEVIKNKIRQKELDFIPAGVAVLEDPELGQDPEVRRWIACLPYCMGGNLAWSQESGRYNVGVLPDGLEFPSLPYSLEPTPPTELVDDVVESKLRNAIFNVEDVPAPDFSIDADPIETGLAMIYATSQAQGRDAGILGLETHSVLLPDAEPLQETALDICLTAVSTLLRRYKIDPPTIGRFDFVTDKSLRGVSSTSLALRVGQLFIPHLEIVESCNSAIAALLNTINWIECRGWDGRNSILCAIEKTESRIGAVAVLVGANAPIVIEPDQGRFIGNIECLPTDAEYANFYLTALDDTYSAYRSTVLSCSKNHNPNGTANGRVNGSTNDNPNGATMGTKGSSWDPDGKMVSSFEFDFMIYDRQDLSETAHARMLLNDYLSRPEAKEFQNIPTFMRSLTPDAAFLSRFVVDIFLRASAEDHHTRVAPAAMDSDMTTTYPFLGLMALLERVPGYELFEKRIATFICNPQGTNYFCVLRVKGDTDMLRTDMLSKQLDK